MATGTEADALAAWEEYRRRASDARDLRWERRFLSARLLARAVMGVLHFGAGKAERIAAAMVLSAPFFLLFLLVGRLNGLDSGTVLPAAFVALFAGFLSLAALGVWGEDERLRKRLAESETEYEAARWWAEQTREEWALLDAERLADEKAERERLAEEARHTADTEASKRLAEERAAAEAERRRRAAPVDCPHCYAKIDRRATICKNCRRVVRKGGETAPPPKPTGKTHLIAGLASAIVPGLGQIIRGRILAGIAILFVVFPAVIGCGVWSLGAGAVTGNVAFYLAAVLVPVVYLSIILDAASAD
jgi:TM2 domain-containing membrane protein YozV